MLKISQRDSFDSQLFLLHSGIAQGIDSIQEYCFSPHLNTENSDLLYWHTAFLLLYRRTSLIAFIVSGVQPQSRKHSPQIKSRGRTDMPQQTFYTETMTNNDDLQQQLR